MFFRRRPPGETGGDGKKYQRHDVVQSATNTIQGINSTIYTRTMGYYIPVKNGKQEENILRKQEKIEDEKKEDEYKKEKYKKKKVRRKRTINKKIDNIRIYYINIRGIKSKIQTLKSIIKEEKPDIVGIVETMLDEKENINIEGYKIIRNDRNGEGGGVLIAVKEKLWNITIEMVGRTKQKKAFG